MSAHALTPVQPCGSWWAKREDRACYRGPEWPSGSKVRQFTDMLAAAAPGTPLVVGCGAFSAIQVYLAAAGQDAGVPAHVFIPGRKQERPVAGEAQLPCGTPLDAYYAAKALACVQDGDCLWVAGRRPLSINR